jgi:hypothetical protein
MLIYRTIESHLINLTGILRGIVSVVEHDKPTYLRKIPFAFSMAISVPSNIFVRYWPEIWLEHNTNYK